VEEVASGAQQTPQTGPQAWIILALALLMTAVVFVKNKVA
jgi:hypothetical protein